MTCEMSKYSRHISVSEVFFIYCDASQWGLRYSSGIHCSARRAVVRLFSFKFLNFSVRFFIQELSKHRR